MVLITAVFLPIILGALLLCVPFKLDFKGQCIYTGISLWISAIAIILAVLTGAGVGAIDALKLNSTLVISFSVDNLGKLFAIVMMIVWVCAGFFSFEYMKHEGNTKRYFGMYILVLGVLMGLCFSGNLVTYYTFYEFMTIGTFAMVLHNQSHEAIMAGLKYMFYSFAGAYMVLFGLYFVHQYAIDPAMSFVQGGILDTAKALSDGSLRMLGTSQGGGVLMVSMLLMIMGFSVKAGMFPMHGWLPTAHPVAPAPASAVLSAIIVKSGVLGIIRVIYYVFGSELFSGSYVQKIVLILSLITVFMGSMLAFRERVLKKRLAYSTVSQVSYILFGVFVVNQTAFQGALLHVAAHAAIKSTLFLCAGAIIYITGVTKVDELRGIGRKMPIMLWCYTIVSLGLIGIPPFGGFTSKWYLGIGAMESAIPVFGWLGPVVLLISALLTAGYLLPLTINGFLPGNTFEDDANAIEFIEGETFKNYEIRVKYAAYIKAHEPKLIMLIPIIILTVLSVLVGLFPEVVLWV